MKNRIKVYWILLLVLLYTAGTVLCVGEAQARYVNTATWNTVVQPKETAVTSDCLESVSGPELTVLLGTMPQEGCDVPFTITAGEAVSGKLRWKVDLTEYISVQMHIEDTPITPETTVEIAAGETITVVMTLIPAEHTFTDAREELDVAIEVTWADTLRGTFLTQLSAVEEEEEPTEETEPEETEPSEPEETEPSEPEETKPSEPEETKPSEPEETEPTEPEETKPSEPEESEPTEPEPTDPTDPPTPGNPPVEKYGSETGAAQIYPGLTMILRDPWISLVRFCVPVLSGRSDTVLTEPPVSEPGEPVPEETEPDQPEPTEPPADSETEDPTEPSIVTEDPAEPSEPPQEDPENPTEPDQQEPAEEMTVVLEVTDSVNSAGALPLQITAPDNGGPIRLGLVSQTEPVDTEEESQTVLENFPRYTRYSLDNGSSCYMLYQEDTIALDLQQGEALTVLLDLSRVQLENSQVVLGATPQEGSEITTCDVTLIPESIRWAEFPTRILSVAQPLEIAINEQAKDFVLEYSLEMLTAVKSEDGETETVAYVPVELSEDGLWAELITDETGTKLILSIGKELPQAGTYRISFSWSYEETVCAQMQETIFINYLVYTESENTGGAEQ